MKGAVTSQSSSQGPERSASRRSRSQVARAIKPPSVSSSANTSRYQFIVLLSRLAVRSFVNGSALSLAELLILTLQLGDLFLSDHLLANLERAGAAFCYL